MYTWTDNKDDEIWRHDEFDTEAECVQDAIENYCLTSGDTILVGTIVKYVPIVDVDTLLERMEDYAYEDCGEVAEYWNVSTRKGHEDAWDELDNAISSAVNTYLEQIGMKPDFDKIEDIYEVCIG